MRMSNRHSGYSMPDTRYGMGTGACDLLQQPAFRARHRACRSFPAPRSSLPALAALCLVLCGSSRSADVKPLVDKFQAQGEAEGQAAAAEILRQGAPGVKAVCALLAEPSVGGDEKARFALHAAVLWAARPNADGERKLVEGAMLEALGAAAGPEVKAFLLEQLRLVASDASVPAMAQWLGDERLCEPATHVLTTLRTPAAGAALAAALPNVKGRNLLTVLRALGELREKGATAAILPLATGDDAVLRQVAWYALANIGEPKALDSIRKASEGQARYERSLATRALLLLAQRLAEQGDKSACAKICRDLASSRKDPSENHVVCHALAMLAETNGADALPDLLARLDDKDLKVREAVLQSLLVVKGPGVAECLVAQLPKVTPEARALLVRALGLQKDQAALPALTRALKDESPAVRQAAVRALADLGSVPSLIEALGQAQADEARIIRTVLGTSRAEGLTAALGTALPKASPAGQAVILEVLGDRAAADQADAVFAALKSGETGVKSAAAKALGTVCVQKDVPRLVEALLAETDPALCNALGRALANAARKGAPDVKPIVAALAKASGGARLEIQSALARIGGPEALKAVTADLGAQDAAIGEGALRALCEWNGAEAAPVLLKLLKEAKERKQQVLALRGFLRAIGLPEGSTGKEQAVEWLKEALRAVQAPEDKRQVLGALGGVAHPSAATLAAGCLDDAALKEDAASAVLRIVAPSPSEAKGLTGPAVVDALKKALAATGNPDFRKKAQEQLDRLGVR
mgnify:CR=1 FL=1